MIVVDNASTDRSAEVAAEHGATVVREERPGYGSAYLAGLAVARGDYVVMGDADETYPMQELAPFVERLEQGDDLVLGSRFEGTIHGDAMPWLNRRVGNPILTGLLNVLFGVKVSDAHCGMRAVRRDALAALDLHSTGMEFASEMVFKAYRRKLRVSEIPIDYYPRVGESKLNRFGDAWRHVRFMLALQPELAVLRPRRRSCSCSGSSARSRSRPGRSTIFGRTWQIHTMLACMVAILARGAGRPARGLRPRVRACAPRRARPASSSAHTAGSGSSTVSPEAGSCSSRASCMLLVDLRRAGRSTASARSSTRTRRALGFTLFALGVQVVLGSFFLSLLTMRTTDPSQCESTRRGAFPSDERRVRPAQRAAAGRPCACSSSPSPVAAERRARRGLLVRLPRWPARRARGDASSGSTRSRRSRGQPGLCEQVLVGDVEVMELPFPRAFVRRDALRRRRRAPPRPRDDTRRCAPLLRPGGRLVLTTPNVANWAMRPGAPRRLAGGYTDRGILDRTHTHLFTRKTLEQTLERAGYRIVAFDRHGAASASSARQPSSALAHAIARSPLALSRTSSSSLRRRRDLGRHPRQERRCRSRALPRTAIPPQKVDEEVEVVVVDSGSDRRQRRAARETRRGRARDPTERVRPRRARGTWASSSSRGEMRRLHDAGRRPQTTSDWLARARARRARDQDVAGAYGRQLAHRDARPPERFFLEFMYGPKPRVQRLEPGAELDLRADALLERQRARSRARSSSANPFRDDLTMSEDQEWSRRVLRDGHALVYEPLAAVRHSHAYTLRSAFRRFFDSGVSAEHAYVAGDESRAALRRAGARYAQEELAGCGVPDTGAGSRTPSSTSSAKFAGLQLGLRHHRLPRSVVRRLGSCDTG